MDTFHMLITLTFTLVAVFGLKMLLDQYRFLKLYRMRVNPPFPILPGEKASNFAGKGSVNGPLKAAAMGRSAGIMLKRAPSRELEQYRRRVWIDFALTFAVMLIGFLSIVISVKLAA